MLREVAPAIFTTDTEQEQDPNNDVTKPSDAEDADIALDHTRDPSDPEAADNALNWTLQEIQDESSIVPRQPAFS